MPRPPVQRTIPPEERGLSALAYLVPLVTSVGLLAFDKRHAAVRFHAAQALALDVLVAALLFGVLRVLDFAFVPPELAFRFINNAWDFLVFFLFTLPRLVLLIQSARGVHTRIPWLADFADARTHTIQQPAQATGQPPSAPAGPDAGGGGYGVPPSGNTP